MYESFNFSTSCHTRCWVQRKVLRTEKLMINFWVVLLFCDVISSDLSNLLYHNWYVEWAQGKGWVPDPASTEAWFWEKKMDPQEGLGQEQALWEQSPREESSATSGDSGRAVLVGVWVATSRHAWCTQKSHWHILAAQWLISSSWLSFTKKFIIICYL